MPSFKRVLQVLFDFNLEDEYLIRLDMSDNLSLNILHKTYENRYFVQVNVHPAISTSL